MDARSGFQIWISDLDVRSGFQIWIPDLDAGSGFQIWMPDPDARSGSRQNRFARNIGKVLIKDVVES